MKSYKQFIAELKLPRQLKDPKKEMEVVKDNKVKVIDKKDWPKFKKDGWMLAEANLSEAGDKPLEKQYGMGDSRSAKELKDQIRDLPDKTLKIWAKSPDSMFNSKVAKMQGKLVKSEMRKRGL